MRLWLTFGCLLLVGCSGPASNGGLWAQQNLQQELALARLSDAQRAATARAFEVGVVDAALSQERARLEGLLDDCPGVQRQPLSVSTGDRTRDGIRIQSGNDATRVSTVALLALADWRLRRA